MFRGIDTKAVIILTVLVIYFDCYQYKPVISFQTQVHLQDISARDKTLPHLLCLLIYTETLKKGKYRHYRCRFAQDCLMPFLSIFVSY